MDNTEDKKFMCIYVLEMMYRNCIYADTLSQLHDILSMKGLVSELEKSEEAEEEELLAKIYAEGGRTAGRLMVYRYNEKYDPEQDYESDKYIPYMSSNDSDHLRSQKDDKSVY